MSDEIVFTFKQFVDHYLEQSAAAMARQDARPGGHDMREVHEGFDRLIAGFARDGLYRHAYLLAGLRLAITNAEDLDVIEVAIDDVPMVRAVAAEVAGRGDDDAPAGEDAAPCPGCGGMHGGEAHEERFDARQFAREYLDAHRRAKAAVDKIAGPARGLDELAPVDRAAALVESLLFAGLDVEAAHVAMLRAAHMGGHAASMVAITEALVRLPSTRMVLIGMFERRVAARRSARDN